MRHINLFRGFSVALLALATFTLASARAAFLTAPYGNPTGAKSKTSPKQFDGKSYTVNVLAAGENAAMLNVDLATVLSTQGFDAAHGWTINSLSVRAVSVYS
ncbi:MAG: hypothetical protein K2X87_34490 [Gemmataceae bacterium]|nr:hypothetical protein [Gemmataceae bacterium]